MSAHDDLPVVIINGLGASRPLAEGYAMVFRARGFKTYSCPQRILGFGDIRISAKLVAGEVERVLRETGAPKVKLVGMSLGGLIGLYYIKCDGGAPLVERFISVGGPLNGSALAHVSALIPSEAVHALAQSRPDSDIQRRIHAAPNPPGVRLISVGTKGDVMTPRASWEVPGMENVETPYGGCPIGHWLLFTHPGNHRVVADLLRQ